MKPKRIVAAALAATCLTAGAYAFASSLNVNSDTLSAGKTVTLSCQPTNPVTVTYPLGDLVYDKTATASGYKVTNVVLTGVEAGCVGKTASLELTTNSDGTPLAESRPVTLALGSNNFAIDGVIDAKLVTGASVVLSTTP